MLDELTLPVHPFTGLTALGFRRNGGPIWPIVGASDDDEGDDKSEDSNDDGAAEGDADDDGGEKDEPLGEAGTKALQAEKAKRREAQAALREFKSLGLKPAEIKAILDARKADEDDKPDPERIKEQARNEARAEVQRERVLDKIEAKAGSRFALDAEDVAALVMRRHDINDFLDDDGKVDAEAIAEALDELLEKQPGLAAQGGKRFSGSADGGTRKESRPAQLTEADVKRLKAEGKHREIEQARKDGRLNDLLGITSA